MTARSVERFPTLAGPACPWHAQEGVACTPMDCENHRRIPELGTTPRP